MGATDRDHFPPTRRFITRHDVEDAARTGSPVRLRDRDVVTHEAAQRARDLGVVLQRGDGPPSPARPPAGAAPSPPQPAQSDDALREAVRAAVVAELGTAPPGLDEAITTVLRSRRS